MPLEHREVWVTSHLSKQPGLLFNHSHNKDISLMSSLNLLFIKFCAVLILSSIPRSRAWNLKGKEVTSGTPLLQNGQPNVLSLSSHDMPSRPITSFIALLWMLSRTFTSFSYCGAQNSTQYSRWAHAWLCSKCVLSSLVASTRCWLVLSSCHHHHQVPWFWAAHLPPNIFLCWTSCSFWWPRALKSIAILPQGLPPRSQNHLPL